MCMCVCAALFQLLPRTHATQPAAREVEMSRMGMDLGLGLGMGCDRETIRQPATSSPGQLPHNFYGIRAAAAVCEEPHMATATFKSEFSQDSLFLF